MTCSKIQVPLPEKYVRTGPAYSACSVDTTKKLVAGLTTTLREMIPLLKIMVWKLIAGTYSNRTYYMLI